MIGVDNDFDAFREDFVVYLAARLGVSREAALSYLGDWLIAFKADAHPPALGETIEG
ncbi:MAG TPA: hypothetical protein VHP33_41350 [Polyangiaceae bacterium]|nr:hypothetical protein [Polyangiaceae bacterium]